MTKSEQLLIFVNTLMERQFKKLRITELQKVGIRMSVYNIFEENYDIEHAYYELIEFLEDEENLTSLIPEIKEHYSKINN
jgi:uncharacterized protein YggL (DUF469 family)